MSKISAPTGVDYSAVHWFQKVNLRKNDKSFGNPLSDVDYKIVAPEKPDEDEKVLGLTKDGLVYPLRNGWEPTQGAITVERATKQQAAEAIEDRKRRIAELEKNESLLPLAATLREVWFPNNKPASVEWIGNNCYRRSVGIGGVLLRRRRDAEGKDWDKSYTVYVCPKEFAGGEKGQVDKLNDHLVENLMKDVGRNLMQPVDFFHAAMQYRALRGANARESDLVKLGLKRGEAQRAFALAAINADFPELHLAERSILKVERDDEGKEKPYIYEAFKSRVDIAKLRHADCVALNNAQMPGGVKTPAGEPIKIKGGRKAILHAIESYIRDAMTGGKGAVLTSTNIVKTAAKSPVHLLQALAAKWAKNDGNFAEFIGKHAERINKALAFLDADPDYAKVVADESAADDTESEEPATKQHAKA